MLGISGWRFSVAMARNFSCPASTFPFCVRLESVRSVCPPRIAFIRGARPSYETYFNLMLAACSMSAGKKWLGGGSGGPPAIWPGGGLASARNSCQFFHGVFGLAVSTEAVDEIRQIGSKSVYLTS